MSGRVKTQAEIDLELAKLATMRRARIVYLEGALKALSGEPRPGPNEPIALAGYADGLTIRLEDAPHIHQRAETARREGAHVGGAGVKPSDTYLPNLQRGSVAATWAPIADHFLRGVRPVLDLTHRTGRQWAKLAPPPGWLVRCDLDASKPIDVATDCRTLPFRAGLFGAVVVDLPWCEDAGKRSYAGPKYACTHKRPAELLDLVRADEWARVTRPGGLLFMRGQDSHHEGKFRDLMFDFGARVRACALWEPWDRVFTETGGRPPRYASTGTPKTRKVCSWWLLFRRRRA